MLWNKALSQLRNALMALYSDEASARRVVKDAEVDEAQIAFSTKAINNWQAILEVAQANDQVEAIIAVTGKEFARNQALLDAIDGYREWAAGAGTEPVPAEAGISEQRLRRMSARQKMQLVDALLECQVVGNHEMRDTVVGELPVQVRHNIRRNSTDRVDVANIVTTALDYPGGMQSLVDTVRLFEGDSFAMQEADRVLAELA